MFDFVEKRYPEIQTFSVEGAKSLPQSVVDEVRSFCAWHWYRGLYLLCRHMPVAYPPCFPRQRGMLPCCFHCG